MTQHVQTQERRHKAAVASRSVALITHPVCIAHDPGPWHPECPDRLRRVLAALDTQEFQPLLRELAPEATEEQLVRVHPEDYVRAICGIRPDEGEYTAIDADTAMSAKSAEAALRSAGGAVLAVDAVMEGWARAAFSACRPPGHHAERNHAMGFCFFANAAVAARHAQARWGLERVAVVDFDVHHGNGTQALFRADPTLFYGSTHQFPCFPGTGAASETGVGNIVNAPLAPNSGSAAFRAAWSDIVLPALDRFAPDLIVVSAGFDAHKSDPLAEINLETSDFVWITEELMKLAAAHCGGRMVSLLEGGYDLAALAASAAAHVRTLLHGCHTPGQ